MSRDALFNELGCGGGATLFVDNIDQIDDEGEWATITDLLRGVLANPGWRAVATARRGNDEWKNKLPEGLREAGIATLQLEELSDAETAILAAGNRALWALLDNTHPARAIARNLFHLSRLLELGTSEQQATLASETDLARAWWRYGGGRGEDGKLARLRILRAIGAAILVEPGRAVLRVDEFEAEVVAELLRLDGLREARSGSTITFRHDVLRDWTIGFLLDEEADRLKALPLDRPLPGTLSRSIEIAARLAIEADATGQRWLSLLAAFEQDGCHGSWRRPVLLALPRSERALELFQRLEGPLLENKGRRLGEIIKLMMAVESEPLAKVIARVQPDIAIPAGAEAIVMPKGQGWAWLVLWSLARAEVMPSALIPDLSKLFQSWLIATQAQWAPLNASIVELLFKWLARIEEAMWPVVVRDIGEAKQHDLDFPHVRDVRDEIRTTCFAFAHLNPAAAQGYLAGLDAEKVRHDEMQFILRGPGSLARAAPTAFVDFALAALIEKDDPDDPYARRYDRYAPFGVHEQVFSPASPAQGPFFELLEHAPAESLRLVRAVVEHATEWHRAPYIEAKRPFPTMSISFPEGAKPFEGDFATYHWTRGSGPCVVSASALMALEAWGHRQIEGGRAFNDVLHDVLGPDRSSVAFVAVATDLALSHWAASRAVVWPLLATPELLHFDNHRHNRDIAGVDGLLGYEREPTSARIKRSDLDARVSRRRQLSDCIGDFVHHGPAETLARIRAALEQAQVRITQTADEGEDPINGLHATAARALRMTDAQHWTLRRARLPDGSEVEGYQFQIDPEEEARLSAARARSDENMQHFNMRLQIQAALFHPAKSTADIVRAGIDWAKAQPSMRERQSDDDEDKDDFDREWDRRAIVMAAALAARDYDEQDRREVMAWAQAILDSAVNDADQKYHGNDQMEYSVAAIATLGFIALHRREETPDRRDALVQLAAHSHPAVLSAVGIHLGDVHQLDPRVTRSAVRIIMASCIHPRRQLVAELDQKSEQESRDRIADAIGAEKSWLGGTGMEPEWPVQPSWMTRRRRGIRLPGGSEEEEEAEHEEIPDLSADEHRLGNLAGHLVRLTVGEPPEWLVDLATHLMEWTSQANGPHGDDDHDRDHRPIDWNGHFFDFLGILCVALPHEQVLKLVLEPMSGFTEEAFYDAAGTFLRGFDRATLATDTRRPENPAGVRAFLADHIRRGRSFKRLSREKSVMAETHLGDAINAMFYQPSRWGHHGKPYIPLP